MPLPLSVRPVPVWILRVLAVLGILLCLPPAVFGASLIVIDLTDGSGGDAHGLGIVLGGGLIVACLVVMNLLGVALLMLFNRRRAG